MPIKNIIFDLGNVLLDVKPHMVRTFLAHTGDTDVDALHEHLFRTGAYIGLEVGTVSPAEFRNEVRKFSSNHLSDEAIDQAWNTMLGEIPSPRIDLLKKLKERYRLFLLSNTNEIHYDAYSAYVKSTFDTRLEDFFEKAYYSHQMGLRKPDVQIYNKVLEDSRLDPVETLFIDDYLENVRAATKVGLMGFHLDDGKDICGYFDDDLNFNGKLT